MVSPEGSDGKAERMMQVGRVVVVAMLLVVTSFSGSLWVSHRHLRQIEGLAERIATDAVPSIEQLSAANGELRQLGRHVNEYIDRAPRERPGQREEIAATRYRLGAALSAYRVLPHAPGEVPLYDDIEANLVPFDETTKRLLAEADAVPHEHPRLSVAAEFHDQQERTATAIARLRAAKLAVARSASDAILQTRREASALAMVLGAFSLIVALVVGVLVLRLMQARALLVKEHAELLSARATELEAFAGRVAHDLKNPLGVMSLTAQAAAKRPGLDPRLLESLDVVTRQVSRMERVIGGLLEFARAGASPEPFARTALSECLEDAISGVRGKLETSGVALELTAPGELQLACTPGALTSVLSNLLGNAAKYVVEGAQTPRKVAVRARALDGTVRVEVEDNGPGLPHGTEQLVFRPFRRLRQTAQPGTGLGLATVKKIVEAYGGRVGVVTAPGRGSTFWFELAQATGTRASAPSPAPSATAAGGTRLNGRHVLVVDDEVNAAAALADLLQEDGVVPEVAHSGEQGLVQAKADRPDAVVIDVEMPGIGGLAALAELRALYPGLPAIIMSGYAKEHGDIAAALATGGVEYVSKPIDVEKVLRGLEALLPSRAEVAPSAAVAAPVPAVS